MSDLDHGGERTGRKSGPWLRTPCGRGVRGSPRGRPRRGVCARGSEGKRLRAEGADLRVSGGRTWTGRVRPRRSRARSGKPVPEHVDRVAVSLCRAEGVIIV